MRADFALRESDASLRCAEVGIDLLCTSAEGRGEAQNDS